MKEKTDSFADACVQIIEKLAGKESDLELIFKDLTLEFAGLKSKLTGTIALNIRYYSTEKS